jgi:hypothetical protein
LCRKFVGLIPGHTYKVSTRANTLDVESATGEWGFSIHVSCNDPAGDDLSVDQMSGAAPLPRGNVGDAMAAQTGFFSKKNGASTDGNWEPAEAAITLPEGVTSITVWVKCSGESKRMGLDWIRLEDLSEI